VVTDKLKKRDSSVKQGKNLSIVPTGFTGNLCFKAVLLDLVVGKRIKIIAFLEKSKAQFAKEKIVHETLIVSGSSGILKHKLVHFCYKNYEDYKYKMLNTAV